MAGFIDFELTTDEEELAQQALDALEDAFPGWVANEAHLEVALIEELARMVAEAARVATDVPEAVFREYGRKLVGLLPIDGKAAGHLATWTMADNAGYTVPAGTTYAYRTPTGEYQLWQTLADAEVVAGQLAVAGVPGTAVDVGVAGNAISAATEFELIDSLAYVAGITADTESSGGVDAESDEAYLDRLAQELQLLTPRPVLPADFSVLARRTEGVYRAVTVDGYDPDTDTYNNERMVSVAGVHVDGTALTVPERDQMEADLDAMREVNFVVHGIDPSYTTVDVTYEVVPDSGADPAAVELAATEALTGYLSPSRWGGGDEAPPEWRLEPTVRYLEVAAVLNGATGVAYVQLLTLGKNGGAQAAADVALDGVAPLPEAGVITATVV